MNPELLKRTQRLLAAQGYAVQELHGSCFDLLAKREGQLLVLKLLADANALSAQHAAEMQNFASAITAAPLVIAERAGAKLEPGIVALRHGLFTLNLPTFATAVLSQQLFFLRNAAGITASVNGGRLRTARGIAGLSLSELSSRLGISRTRVAQYESAQSHITMQRAGVLTDLFGNAVLDELRLFAPSPSLDIPLRSPVGQKYHALGFRTTETHKLPFDIAARQDEELILTEVGDRFREGLSPLSRLLDADQLVIFTKRKPHDVPALRKDEFFEISGAGELIKFVKTY